MQQEIKFANKEKLIAVNKAKEQIRQEIDKVRNDAYNVKFKFMSFSLKLEIL